MIPATLCLFPLLAGLQASNQAAPITAALGERLQETVPALLERHGEPGLALALVENGLVTLCEGYGLADKESGVPVDGDTLFNVGSISKSVTAWATVRLAEQGAFDLDAPAPSLLEHWPLPESDHDADGITPRRLLDHTAGLSLPSIRGYELTDELPTLGAELAANVAQVNTPGVKHEYSGGGYLLLQLLVEKHSGQSFADAARELVLDPLGMESSRFGFDPAIASKCATPYTTRFEEGRDESGHARWRHRAFVGVSGAALYTSARDLGRFLAAHCDSGAGRSAGRGVLSGEALRSMWVGSDASPRYGLGYELPFAAEGHIVLLHGGSNHGWKSTFLLLPEQAVGIAVLTNTDAAGARRAVLEMFRREVLERL